LGVTKEFISKAPLPLPSPSRGGDEGEGDVCGFTNDRISNLSISRGQSLCYLSLQAGLE